MAFKVGLVGCGGIGPTHAWALKRIPELATLTAVCDLRAEAADALAAEYGATAFCDVASMLKDGGIDAMIVATPHMHHHQPAIEALSQGIPVLVEKPIAATLEQTDAIIAAAKAGGVPVVVCSQRQFMAPVVRVTDAIAEGRIGRIVKCDVRMNGWRDDVYYNHGWKGDMQREGGAAMINQGVHPIAMALGWMGEVESVMAQVGNLTHPDITGEDFADLMVKYKSGAVGSFLFSNSQREGYYAGATVSDENGYNIEIQTDESMFVAGPGETPPPPFPPRVNRWYVPVEGLDDSIPEQRAKANEAREKEFAGILEDDTAAFHNLEHSQQSFHVNALGNFFKGLKGEEEFFVDATLGREAVQLITAAYLSHASGQRITMPLEADPKSENFEGRNSIYRRG